MNLNDIYLIFQYLSFYGHTSSAITLCRWINDVLHTESLPFSVKVLINGEMNTNNFCQILEFLEHSYYIGIPYFNLLHLGIYLLQYS